MPHPLRRLIPQSTVNSLRHLPQSALALARFGAPAKDMTVVGVTGTDGKTTTSSLIHHLLVQAKIPSGMITTVQAVIDGQLLDTGFHTTTPTAWHTQDLLSQARRAGATHMVIEATSIGLDQHRLYGIPFQIAVLTNITQDHFDYHKSYEKYLHTKAKLFLGSQFSILNQDDRSYGPMTAYIQEHNPQTNIITYAIDAAANLQASNIRLTQSGLSFTCRLHHPLFAAQPVEFPVKSPLLGEFNVYNILAAIAAGLALGFDHQTIAKNLPSFQPIAGRQEHLTIQDREVIIDFAHTPNALDSLLKSLKQIFPKSRRLVMFGATGERDSLKRPLMGEIACLHSDVVVFTSDDTYHEPIGQIHKQLIEGASSTQAVRISLSDSIPRNKTVFLTIPDRQEAANYLARISQPGDVVVMLGKGHERSLNLGGVEHPWSEREAVLEAFNQIKK